MYDIKDGDSGAEKDQVTTRVFQAEYSCSFKLIDEVSISQFQIESSGQLTKSEVITSANVKRWTDNM
jgi:hypothetical protein